jgi:hypothetical protein
MAEEQQGSEGTARKQRGRGGGGAAEQPGLERVAEDSFAELTRALREAWGAEDLSERGEEAQREYLERARAAWAPEKLGERYVESMRSYWRLMGAFLDPKTDNAEAYRDYTRDLSDVWATAESSERAREAYRDYIRTLGEALDPEEVERLADEAFRAYVQSLKDALAGVDTGSADPQAFVVLGASMVAAGSLLGATRDAVRQRRAMRGTLTSAHGI